jgi:hypothetical protein
VTRVTDATEWLLGCIAFGDFGRAARRWTIRHMTLSLFDERLEPFTCDAKSAPPPDSFDRPKLAFVDPPDDGPRIDTELARNRSDTKKFGHTQPSQPKTQTHWSTRLVERRCVEEHSQWRTCISDRRRRTLARTRWAAGM